MKKYVSIQLDEERDGFDYINHGYEVVISDRAAYISDTAKRRKGFSSREEAAKFIRQMMLNDEDIEVDRSWHTQGI